MTPSIPGRTQTGVAQGEARRAAILEAATVLFAEHGIQGTTLAQIGTRAGVKRPAILHHFASKEALVHAVLDGHERLFVPTQRSIAQHRGLDAISHLVEIAEWDAEHRERVALWSNLLAETSLTDSTLRQRMLIHYNTFRWAVTEMLKQAQADGELRDGVDHALITNSIIAFFNGIETSWLLDPELPLVATVDAYLQGTVTSLRRPG